MSRKQTYYTEYVLKKKPQASRRMVAIFVGILVFLFVFFPIFGLNWRYQIGGILSILIDGVGTFCLTVGGLFTLVGFVGIFSRSKHWARNVVVGIALLWIGCWCTGAVLNLFGIPIGDATSSGGSGWQ